MSLKKYMLLTDVIEIHQDSRECKLVKVLINHVEEHNVDGYTEAVKDYDSISRLDQWFTTILLRIKKQIADDPELC